MTLYSRYDDIICHKVVNRETVQSNSPVMGRSRCVSSLYLFCNEKTKGFWTPKVTKSLDFWKLLCKHFDKRRLMVN